MDKKNRMATLVCGSVVLGVIGLTVCVGLWLPKSEEIIQGEVEVTDYRLSSKVPARVLEIRVEEGDRVRQGDTLVVYKLESYNLFTDMLEKLNEEVLTFLLRAFIPLRDASDAREARPATQPNRNMQQMRTNDPSQLTTNGEQRSRMPIRVDKTVGRNDPCPCGSGLKYKNCHGKGNV